MSVDEAKAWADFLQAAGGWGVAVVEALILLPMMTLLWKKITKLEDDKGDLITALAAKDERMFSTLDKTNEILHLLRESEKPVFAPITTPQPIALPPSREPSNPALMPIEGGKEK